MRFPRIRLATLVVAACFASAFTAAAQANPAALTTPMNMDGRGTMVSGYDVVAFFDYGKPTIGVQEYFFDYENTFRFRFASKVTMKKFMSDPERYLPAYGGFCAFSLAMSEGAGANLEKSDPMFFKIAEDRLYLFSNAEALEKWNQDEVALMERANANWDAIVAARSRQ